MFEVDFEAVDGLGEWFPFQDSHFDQNTGEWIFDEPIGDAKVRIRRIQPFIQERYSKRNKIAEHVLNPKTRSMERITYYKDLTPDESQKEDDDTWDYVITGLEAFKNKTTGEVIECTRENKLKLIKVPAFNRFVGRCLRILEGIEEEAEKN